MDILGFVTEICATVLCAPLSFIHPAISFVPEGKIDFSKKNIVLIYGFGARPNSMMRLRSRIEELGYNVVVPDFGIATERIEVRARRYSEFLSREICPEYAKLDGARDLDLKVALLGHSMGGFVGAAMRKQNPGFRDIPLITMGTPFWGSPHVNHARFLSAECGLKKTISEMGPDSVLLRDLRDELEHYPEHVYQMVGAWDQVFSRMYHPLPFLRTYQMKSGGHVSMIWFPETELLERVIETAFSEAR